MKAKIVTSNADTGCTLRTSYRSFEDFGKESREQEHEMPYKEEYFRCFQVISTNISILRVRQHGGSRTYSQRRRRARRCEQEEETDFLDIAWVFGAAVSHMGSVNPQRLTHIDEQGKESAS